MRKIEKSLHYKNVQFDLCVCVCNQYPEEEVVVVVFFVLVLRGKVSSFSSGCPEIPCVDQTSLAYTHRLSCLCLHGHHRTRNRNMVFFNKHYFRFVYFTCMNVLPAYM